MKQEDAIPGESKNVVEDPPEINICHAEYTSSFVPETHSRRRVTASEKRLLRKSDTVIIPLAALAYFVNYLVS
jgi:hypothetical protein